MGAIKSPCSAKTEKKGRGRPKFNANSNCDCGQCAKKTLPWMPHEARFTISDNHHPPSRTSKKIPDLMHVDQINKSALKAVGPSSTIVSRSLSNVVNDESSQGGCNEDMLQAQIKLNTEMMARVEALEKERKEFAEMLKNFEGERKQMQKDIDKISKEKDYFKTKHGESSEQLKYLKKKFEKGGKKNQSLDDDQETDKPATESKPLSEISESDEPAKKSQPLDKNSDDIENADDIENRDPNEFN